jgi:hypothetical protein
MTTTNVNIDHPVTGADCGNIAITAFESGIGYWARVVGQYDYTRWSPDDTYDTIDVDDDFVFYTIKYENPNSDTPPVLRSEITPPLIRRGIELALQGTIRKDLVQQIVDEMRPGGELGAVDADVADCIVQLGIFGEIVYS